MSTGSRSSEMRFCFRKSLKEKEKKARKSEDRQGNDPDFSAVHAGVQCHATEVTCHKRGPFPNPASDESLPLQLAGQLPS